MRVAPGVVRLETDQLEDLVDLPWPLLAAARPAPAAPRRCCRRRWPGGRARRRGPGRRSASGPAAAAARAPGGQHVRAVEADVPASGSSSRSISAPERRLAAARLPHEAEHLAGAHVEVDVVDGVHAARRPGRTRRARSGNVLTTPRTSSSTGTVVHRPPARRGRAWPSRRRRCAGSSAPCARAHLDQRRHLLDALREAGLDPRLAARREAAAGRQVDEVRHPARG